MRANTSFDAWTIVRAGWEFTSNAAGSYTVEQLTAAATIDLANTMRRIEGLLNNLGRDGIHELIRYEAQRVRRAERVKRQRAAAKRKRTLAAKKAAKG
jgi:hypothetical protein